MTSTTVTAAGRTRTTSPTPAICMLSVHGDPLAATGAEEAGVGGVHPFPADLGAGPRLDAAHGARMECSAGPQGGMRVA